MTTDPTPDAIHTWFGLSYANYLVLPRTLLQSMPDAWQERLVELLDQYEDAFHDVEQAEAYDVTPGRVVAAEELSKRQRLWAGVTEEDGVLYDRDGDELHPYSRVVVPEPDPVPHYNRGRTRVEPRTRLGVPPIVVDDFDPRAILTRDNPFSWSIKLFYGIGWEGPYVVWGWTPKHAGERAVRRARALLARPRKSDPIVVRPGPASANARKDS